MHAYPTSLHLVFTAAVALGALVGHAAPINEPPPATGLPTVADASHNAFGRVLPNTHPADAARMHAGKRVFVRTWRPASDGRGLNGSDLFGGLGPLYNADSCVSCHFKDGRGGPRETPQPSPTLVFRLDPRPGSDAHGWGEQLQDRAIDRLPEGQIAIDHQLKTGQYADGVEFLLHQPLYRVHGVELQPRLSPRAPPTLVGVGLLESVAATTIVAWEDPNDRDGDGISGRARWVTTDAGRKLGRFGWKASQPSLDTQVAAALAEDMGITSGLRPGAGGEAEITATDFARLIDYLQLLAPPARRAASGPTHELGGRLFGQVGCAACHRPRLITAAASEIAGPVTLAKQTIDPYTDLLLHDLGDELADDGIGEEGVEASEWRTAPLWGLGLMKTVNGGLYLLHDGRAGSFEEAIMWHGGEAQPARQRFSELAANERAALVAFLETL